MTMSDFDKVMAEAWSGDAPQDAYGDIDCGGGVMILVHSDSEHDAGPTKVDTQIRCETIESVILLGKRALALLLLLDARMDGKPMIDRPPPDALVDEWIAVVNDAAKLRRSP